MKSGEFLREIRILKERVALSSDIEIGEQKILITSWKEPIFAVMIKNQFVIQNFTAIFDALWKSIE